MLQKSVIPISPAEIHKATGSSNKTVSESKEPIKQAKVLIHLTHKYCYKVSEKERAHGWILTLTTVTHRRGKDSRKVKPSGINNLSRDDKLYCRHQE